MRGHTAADVATALRAPASTIDALNVDTRYPGGIFLVVWSLNPASYETTLLKPYPWDAMNPVSSSTPPKQIPPAHLASLLRPYGFAGWKSN